MDTRDISRLRLCLCNRCYPAVYHMSPSAPARAGAGGIAPQVTAGQGWPPHREQAARLLDVAIVLVLGWCAGTGVAGSSCSSCSSCTAATRGPVLTNAVCAHLGTFLQRGIVL